jgi:hypothetical protein
MLRVALFLACSSLAACGGSTAEGKGGEGLPDAGADVEVDAHPPVDAQVDAQADAQADAQVDAQTDAPSQGCDLSGTWTLHCEVTQCASTPLDRTMTIAESGTSLTITVPDTIVGAANPQTIMGTLAGRDLELPRYSSLCPDIPAGLSFDGTAAQDCETLSGTFFGECVDGTWSAKKTH